MAKHKGRPSREAELLGSDSLVLILDRRDADLMEDMLSHYARQRYFADNPTAHRFRGHYMRAREARDLAKRIRQAVRRG